MKKIKILSFVLVAVGALSALIVSSAFAAETLPAQFLANGNPITVFPLHFDTSGENVLLEDMKATGGAVDVLCSGLFVGEITSPENAEILELLNLAGTSTMLECTFTTKGLCEGTEALVEAAHLPWLIIPLLVGTNFQLMFENSGAGLPGYAVTCKTILGEVTDTCEGATGALAKNEAGGVLGEFLESNEEITPAGHCSQGGEKAGLLAGSGLTTDTDEPTVILSVSS